MSATKSGRTCVIALATGLALGAALAPPANATIVGLGGGWVASWDSSLDPCLSVATRDVGPDAVYIEKSMLFAQPPADGVFPAIQVQFRQVTPQAVPYLVIDDVVVLNATGVDWDGFTFILQEAGEVRFDQARTFASGTPAPIGFGIDPFTAAAFTSADTRLEVGGGIVPDGDLWFAGNGAANGELWVYAAPAPDASFRSFSLSALPTPEPSSLALLLPGALALRRFRRAA